MLGRALRSASRRAPARSYHDRQHMERHLGALTALANDVAPAAARGTFQRRSKIVATVGPNVADPASIRMLIDAGVNVLRFNFSHGEYDWFEEVIGTIRAVTRESGRTDVAIALDTKGPEIRTGRLALGTPAGDPGYGAPFAAGDEVVFTHDARYAEASDADHVYVDYADVGTTLVPGMSMMVDDGLLEFEVPEASGPTDGPQWVRARAANGGALGERKGVNLPGAEVTLPAVSEKDRADLAFGVKMRVDMVFASFVRKAAHVGEIRDAQCGNRPPVRVGPTHP